MLITVFGANGKTGRHVVEQALERGHQVYAVVRDPASLDLTHERLTVTVMRPPRLTNAPRTGAYRIAIDENVGQTIARADLATEMLRLLDDPATVRHTVGAGY